MTKLLNIDSLIPEERVLRLGGVDYKVNEETVEDFVANTKTAERLGERPSFEAQVNEMVAAIQRQVPDVPAGALRKLSLEKLNAVMGFVRGRDPEEIVRATERRDAPEDAPEQGGAEAGNG